jgi:uncharacterized protein YggE
VFEDPRHFLKVSMRQPRFEASPVVRMAAQARAVADARAKAEALAADARLGICHIVQIEEMSEFVQSSGVVGDQDPISIELALKRRAILTEAADPEAIVAATRSVTVRYRVRFAVEPA